MLIYAACISIKLCAYSDIGSCIHEIELDQDTDFALTLGVDGMGQFESLRTGEIDICR